MHRTTATGLRAVLESSHARDTAVEVSEITPTRATYVCTWH